MIKRFVAAVQHFLINLVDGLHRTGNIDMDGMNLIESFNQSKINPPIRVITVHVDFLRDNAFFLIHILIGKIRMLNKVD